ncbi:MAG: hypothetical protein H6Q24_719, partial [Bacteroidetes bacterium]|nr:hypothetical protein [Bacteroidota bacterium]
MLILLANPSSQYFDPKYATGYAIRE